MSTTNPSNPGPQPGAGRQWPADAANLDRPDDSGGGGGINPAAIAAGHEPDVFAVKPIFSIPVAVVITFIVCFGVTTVLFFSFFRERSPDPLAHPEAKARSDAALNDRLSRTDRQGEDKNDRREVDQPRLEPLRRLENNGQTITQMPLPRGNSPWLHAEDIRPDRVEGLQKAGYVGTDKKVARIPIEDAIRLATEKKDGNTVLPVAKDAPKRIGSGEKPSASNAGQGKMPPAPKKK